MENQTIFENMENATGVVDNTNITSDMDIAENEPNFTWVFELMKVLYYIVFGVGVISNPLLIYYLAKFSKLHIVTKVYMINRAIMDLLAIVALPLLLVTMSKNGWIFGEFWCKIYFTLASVHVFSPSMFLVTMAADLILARCFPSSAKRWRKFRTAIFVSIIVWMITALILVPVFKYANVIYVMENVGNCNLFWPSDSAIFTSTTFILFSFLSGYVMPLVIVLVIGAFLLCKKYSSGAPNSKIVSGSNDNDNDRNHVQVLSNSFDEEAAKSCQSNALLIDPNQRVSHNEDYDQCESNYGKLVFIMCAHYFLSWLLYWVSQIYLLYITNEDGKLHPMLITVFVLAGCLTNSVSAINPILVYIVCEIESVKLRISKICCLASKSYISIRTKN